MHIPETNEILNTGLGSGAPYLGSPAVVDRILRKYLIDLVGIRTDQIENGTDPIPQIKELAEWLQGIFYGQTSGYLPFAWNRPEQLGAFLVEKHGLQGDTSDAVVRLALNIAQVFIPVMVDNEQGKLSDDEMERVIDKLLLYYSRILIGAANE